MNRQRQSYFSVSSFRVPIRNIADYSPFGVQLDGRTIQGDSYRYGFNGMEGDSEFKGQGNSYTTEFRQYDARLGRWLSLDPKANSMPWQSTYCSMDNNPILFIDVFGDSVRNDSKTVAANQAIKAYLSTKEGYNEVAKFAAAGDEILGFKFPTNGEYNNKNIDLIFNDHNFGFHNQGITIYNQSKDGGLVVTLNINSDLNNGIAGGKELIESNNNKAYNTNPKKHTQIWASYVAYKSQTIHHELFVHIEGGVAAFQKSGFRKGLNNGDMNGEEDHTKFGNEVVNNNVSLKNYGNGKYGIVLKKQNAEALYWTTGYKVAKQIHNNLNTGRSDREIIDKLANGLVEFKW